MFCWIYKLQQPKCIFHRGSSRPANARSTGSAHIDLRQFLVLRYFVWIFFSMLTYFAVCTLCNSSAGGILFRLEPLLYCVHEVSSGFELGGKWCQAEARLSAHAPDFCLSLPVFLFWKCKLFLYFRWCLLAGHSVVCVVWICRVCERHWKPENHEILNENIPGAWTGHGNLLFFCQKL